MTETAETWKETMMKEFRPHFQLLLGLANVGGETVIQEMSETHLGEHRDALLHRVVELATVDEQTVPSADLAEHVDAAWKELLPTIFTVCELELSKEQGLVLDNPGALFPKEEAFRSAEECRDILQTALYPDGVQKPEKADKPEEVTEEKPEKADKPEEVTEEKPPLENVVIDPKKADKPEEVTEEKPEKADKPDWVKAAEAVEGLALVSEAHTQNEVINWPWYIELMKMSDGAELADLPKTVIALHNKGLLKTKRNMLDTILMALLGDIDTTGVEQITALFETLSN